MFSYESGVLIALLLWLWITIGAIVAINSRMNRNLKKIGQRLSWLTLSPKPMSQDELQHSWFRKLMKFMLLYGTGLPFVLTSWLYVAYVAGLFAYRRSKDSGAPQSVREFRWKLKNTDMSFDQLVRELMKLSDQDPADFETTKATIMRELQEQGLRPGQ